ncbi:hypothetical protein [Shewanella algidipiscicola]|uniref:hypothetical protein n=1 Tax=Shewanella algidipiscicola TaxID=614070 RepID=UPI000D789B47|nr:hypothetical protein [Shewanella algidipiscicola]
MDAELAFRHGRCSSTIPVGSTPASLLAKAAAAFTLGIERFFDLAAFGVNSELKANVLLPQNVLVLE